MGILEKLKHLCGVGSLELVAPKQGLHDGLPEQEIRRRAMRMKTAADKWGVCPSGPMTSVPKVARAFAFYMRAPVLFRHMHTTQSGMQEMLREHGIEAPDEALGDPVLLLPFWNTLEAQLPAGPSVHEQWAARFYDA